MPLLSTETKSNISFKKLVGKAHTGNATDFFQEAIPSQISIDSSEVVGEPIPKDPAQASSDGLVEFVEADLQQISASNGLAFNLRFPTTYSGFFGVSAAGNLIRSETQIVDQKNNLDGGPAKSDNSGGYVYDLKDGFGNDISLGSEEGWQIDPAAGVLSSEEVISELENAGGSVRLYVYTGDFLNSIVENLKGGVLTAPGNDNEVTFNDGGQIGTSSNFTFDGTTLSVPHIESDTAVLLSPDGTPYEVTVTNAGNLKTELTTGGLADRAANLNRLTYDTETLEVQAAAGQTAPLFRGDGENDNSVFEVSPTGKVSIKTAGEGLELTSPNGTVYSITVKDDGTLKIDEV